LSSSLDPVQALTAASRRLASFLADMDEPFSDLQRIDIAVTEADTVSMLAGQRASTWPRTHASRPQPSHWRRSSEPTGSR
jgi:hypothetical protein